LSNKWPEDKSRGQKIFFGFVKSFRAKSESPAVCVLGGGGRCGCVRAGGHLGCVCVVGGVADTHTHTHTLLIKSCLSLCSPLALQLSHVALCHPSSLKPAATQTTRSTRNRQECIVIRKFVDETSPNRKATATNDSLFTVRE
jgi:hypothetical protein